MNNVLTHRNVRLWRRLAEDAGTRASIGADSTGATGAVAPVLIKEPGQRSPFAPVIFEKSIIVSILPQLVMTT